MSNHYRNPLAGNTTTGPWSPTSLDRDYGTNFSVYNIGGYMEVDTIDDLNYVVNGTGNIFDSGNTIPLKYYKSPNILTDKLYLWNDGISSGRRRLGMLVYVLQTDQVYQYVIPNYESLYTAATSAGVVIGNPDTDTYLEVRNKIGTTPNSAGQALMDAWLDSSIEGVSGVTRNNARWRIFWGTDWQVTGGTVDYNSTGDLNLNSNSGNTVTISGLKTITGGTYFSGTSTLELYNNLGDTIDITGFSSGDGFTLSGNTTDGLISYGTPSVGIVENNLTFNGDNNTLTLSGDSVTNGVEYQQTESTTTVTNGNHNIYTILLTSGCTFEYTYFVEENNTGVFRSGKILTSLNNSKTNVVYNDYSTEDGIGSTEDIEFESLISGSNLVLRAVTTNNTQWTIKIKLNVLF